MASTKARTVFAIAAGTLLGVSALSVWYVVSPTLTIEAMADAAVRGDAEELVTYVDMQALRRDVRRQATRMLGHYRTDKVRMNPDMMVEALAGEVIDKAFSIEGARQAVTGTRRAIGNRSDLRYQILRDGPNRFVARLDMPRRVDLMFTRSGAGWVLAGIRMRPALRQRDMV